MRPHLALAVLAITVILYLGTPSHPGSFSDGLPMHPLGVVVALALPAVLYGLGAWLPRKGSLLVAAVLLSLGLLKLGIAAVSPEYGLVASYFENSRFNGAPERSTEYRARDYTRLDRTLDFGGDEFPVFFFNDSERFNFFGSGQPERRNLPFSVRWAGSVVIPTDGTYTFRLTASGPASVQIGDGLRLAVNADGRASQERSFDLRAGDVPLRAEYARRPPRSPDFRLDWMQDSRAVPLSAPYLRPTSGGPSLATDSTLRAAAVGIDLVAAVAVLGLIGAAVWHGIRLAARQPDWSARAQSLERPVLSLVALGFALWGALPRLDRVGKMVYLGGGQDWLLHETLARDILINGPLMTLGKELGEGRAFYAQPLYPYFLAVLHALFGEDQFGATAAQVAILGFSIIVMWELTRRLFGRTVAWIALPLFTTFALIQLDWVARRLLSEALYFLVLPLTLLGLVVAHQSGGTRVTVASGLALGISVLTRGTTLLLSPIAALLLARRQGMHRALLLLVVAGAVISLAPIRNVIASGRPVLLATSGGVNLEKFHRPSDMVRLARADDNPLYNALSLDKPTREVLEFIRQDPLGYFQACLVLAAYTVGFGFALDEAQVPLYPDLIVFSAIYLITILMSRRARSVESLYVHGFIGIHFLSMVIFTPYDYENRLVLPMFLPVLSFVALGIYEAISWVARLNPRIVPVARPRTPVAADVTDGR